MYDPLHPAVLKLIAQAIRSANKSKKPIAVCGEMAGELRLTRLLLGFGLRNFSMHPAHLLTVKQRVLTSEVVALKQLVDRIRKAVLANLVMGVVIVVTMKLGAAL